MTNYQIITDSGCDFTAAEYDRLELKVVPLVVDFDGTTSEDRNDDSLKDFYSGLRRGAEAKTSAVNPERWRETMDPCLKQGRDVLVMAFSSGLSTTCQSARIAADELGEKYPQRKILVVDTLCASLGQGLLAWYACKKRDEGMGLEELHSWVEENKMHVCHWFTVDDLMYLKRGGRVSAATALVGTMLQIKPVLHVDDEGHLINKAKVRGRKASIDALVKKMQETALPGENDLAYICHGDCEADAQYLAQQIKEKCGVKEVFYLSDKYGQTMSTLASKRMLDAAGVKYTRMRTELKSITLDFVPEEEK